MKLPAVSSSAERVTDSREGVCSVESVTDI
jgi:hypothetical protein